MTWQDALIATMLVSGIMIRIFSTRRAVRAYLVVANGVLAYWFLIAHMPLTAVAFLASLFFAVYQSLKEPIT